MSLTSRAGIAGPENRRSMCSAQTQTVNFSTSKRGWERERDRERTYIPGSDPKIDDHHFRNLNLDLVRGEKESNVNVISSFFAHTRIFFFCCFAFSFSTFTPRMLRSKYNHKHGQDYSTAATRGTVKYDVFLSSTLPPLCQKMQNVCCQTNHRERWRGKTKTILFWPGALDIDFSIWVPMGNFEQNFHWKDTKIFQGATNKNRCFVGDSGCLYKFRKILQVVRIPNFISTTREKIEGPETDLDLKLDETDHLTQLVTLPDKRK